MLDMQLMNRKLCKQNTKQLEMQKKPRDVLFVGVPRWLFLQKAFT